MRKVAIISTILFLTNPILGQQFLWSTIQNDSINEKYVPIESVTNEVLEFYDHYKMHYDFSGFSKERFLREMDFGFDDWKWVNEITDLSVSAMKTNMGSGSIVIVLCISEKNINMVVFSNQVIENDFNYLGNYRYERDKFERWFKTLLN